LNANADEGASALLHRFAAAGAAMRYQTAATKQTVGDLLSLRKHRFKRRNDV